MWFYFTYAIRRMHKILSEFMTESITAVGTYLTCILQMHSSNLVQNTNICHEGGS